MPGRVTPLTKIAATSKLRVTRSFSAQQSASRARGNFAVGDLLALQEGVEPSGQLRFVRVNGLRPNAGRECHYLAESEELHLNTEAI
ncbi:MAG: hypothetical protein JWP63_6174 [Candidatus Solibacter sp.]|jgi:hypothetical protein|nr:hypothetical protein [Candidatus Solibacter sp.]